jgi:hypothetical protein
LLLASRFFQVFGGVLQQFDAVLVVPKPSVAIVAQQPADLAGLMAVVNCQTPAGLAFLAADLAHTALLLEHAVVVLKGDAVMTLQVRAPPGIWVAASVFLVRRLLLLRVLGSALPGGLAHTLPALGPQHTLSVSTRAELRVRLRDAAPRTFLRDIIGHTGNLWRSARKHKEPAPVYYAQ